MAIPRASAAAMTSASRTEPPGWMALVAAELVGASSGLGFLINDARSVLRTDIVILGMLTIGCVGLAIDLLIRRIAKAMLPWSLAAQK